VGKALVALDTDHIKEYVFGTDRLKEIRGASSLLDYLNRVVMTELAEYYHGEKVYANGGSGLFLIAAEQADAFGKHVQQSYHEVSGGGVSVTFVSLPLPEHIVDIGDDDIGDIFELLQWHLQEAKQHSPESLAMASHPFMRLCDACGIEYADAAAPSREIVRGPGEEDEQYCTSCQLKRARDSEVEKLIQDIEARHAVPYNEYLWTEIISCLRKRGYDLPPQTLPPSDFNVFRNFKGAKDYLGLIYADANNMGRALEKQCSLVSRQKFANTVDKAIYTSVCTAITRHLKVTDHLKPKEQQTDDLENPVFPFDILLMGGDDICMVVPASVAMDVALTIAETFYNETNKEYTLSAGVILAPVKYPFGLLQEMAETALKFAKKTGADARAKAKKADTTIDDTRINFMIVTGSSSSDFTSVYNTAYHRQDDNMHQEFHATLRPYTPDYLRILLGAIRDKDGANLGRTKLHQIREAVLKMNLTTSVGDGLAVLRNWREKQRNHVVRQVYEFSGNYQMPRSNLDNPASGFPHVTFPWFADGKDEKNGADIYRTSLLDFTELYDFLAREDGDHSEKG